MSDRLARLGQKLWRNEGQPFTYDMVRTLASSVDLSSRQERPGSVCSSHDPSAGGSALCEQFSLRIEGNSMQSEAKRL